jgi:hypothetical protein
MNGGENEDRFAADHAGFAVKEKVAAIDGRHQQEMNP